MQGQPQLRGVRWTRGDYSKVGAVERGARDYTRSQGLAYRPAANYQGVRADPNNIAAIGLSVRSQQGVPTHVSPQMHASYRALSEGIESQYTHMTTPREQGGMGISVEVSREDPYASMTEARHDVVKNSRMKVLATETTASGHQGHHPMLTPEVNDKFRAIHDVFGHLAIGRNTDRHGEEAAVQHHAQMFHPDAHPALFSELRGQNSALIYNQEFPEDKPYNLPQWASTPSGKQPAPPKRKPEGEQGRLF